MRVAPEAVVPIPTKPRGPVMNDVFKVATFALVVAKTFGPVRAFEVHALPATFRDAPPPMAPRPMELPVVP